MASIRQFLTLSILLLGLTACIGNTFKQTPALPVPDSISVSEKTGPLPRLQVYGNRIVDENGKTLLLRGLNTGDIFELYWDGRFTEDYFRNAASWGTKLLRIIVTPGNFKKMGKDASYKLIDQAVEWCRKYGMYAMIDWHSIGNPVTGVFLDPADAYRTDAQDMKAFWKETAIRYKDNSTAAFYEIFNEPGCIPWKNDRISWSDWRRIADDVVGVIYSIHSNAVPVVGGIGFSSDFRKFKEDPFQSKGIVLSVHPYPGNLPEPWEENWEKYFGHLSKDYPMMFTEFGFDPHDTIAPQVFKADAAYGRRIIDFAEKRNISWTAFVFYNAKYWPMPLFQDWKTLTPTESGAFFKSELIRSFNSNRN